MSDDTQACAAREPKDVEDQVMNTNIPKSEGEWWAMREIERLRAERHAALAHIKVLTEALEASGVCLVTMIAKAYEVGLEGTSDWDQIAGWANTHGVKDAVKEALSQSPATSLAERDKRVRAETLKKAAKIAGYVPVEFSDGTQEWNAGFQAACESSSGAIRALATSQPKEGSDG